MVGLDLGPAVQVALTQPHPEDLQGVGCRFGLDAFCHNGGTDPSPEAHLSLADLERMAAFRDLLSSGVPGPEAASISTPPAGAIQPFLDAASRLDSLALHRILDAAAIAEGVEETVTTLLLPAMFRVGELWKARALDVGHEHLATQTVRSWLGRRQAGVTPGQPIGSVVLAAPSGEHHTIGMEAFAALLALRGLRCSVLGANVPAESVRKVVEGTTADALVLSAQLRVNHGRAVATLRRLSGLDISLFYAGRAFAARTSRRGVPGNYLGSDLSRAAEMVAEALSHAAT